MQYPTESPRICLQVHGCVFSQTELSKFGICPALASQILHSVRTRQLTMVAAPLEPLCITDELCYCLIVYTVCYISCGKKRHANRSNMLHTITLCSLYTHGTCFTFYRAPQLHVELGHLQI